MSKITVTTLAGHTSGADANKVKVESGDTLEVVTNATVGGTLTTTGAATFQDDINVGTTTNLLSNGDFTTNTTGWAATGSALAISSGALQITPNSGVNGYANQQVDNLVVGKSYVASVNVTQDAGPYARLYIGTSANGNQTVTSTNLGTGTHSFTFVATATTHHFALVVGGGTGQVTKFDDARLTEASRIIFPAISGTAPEIKQGTTVNDLALATGQVNRLNINANGQVTMPSQPSFGASYTGTNGWADPSSGTVNVPFNTASIHPNNHNIGNHYNTTNFRFTAPVAGRYIFLVHMGHFYLSQNENNVLEMRKNGTRFAYNYKAVPNTNGVNYYDSGEMSFIINLAVNDYVNVTMGGTGQYYKGPSEIAFSGHLLG